MMAGSTFRQRKRFRQAGPKTSLARSGLVPVTPARAELNLARRVQQLSKFVKGLRPEIKYIDVSLSANNIVAVNGLVVHMTAIPQATAVNARIGENVQVRWIECHIEVPWTASVQTSTNDNPSYRVYIVQDTQQVASTAPALSDLVDQPALPTVQLFNVTEQKRFRVLYDSQPQILQIGTAGASTVTQPSVVTLGKWQIHFKKRVAIPVEFNGSGGSNIQKNGIYFILSTDMTSNTMDIIGSSRIGYTDV